MARLLGNFAYQLRKGHVCSNDTGIILGRNPDTVRGPDVVFHDQVRHYDDLAAGYFDRAPTLAVEVLSSNDQWAKVTRRITSFLDRGVGVVWLVDPEGHSVTIWRPNQLPQVFEGHDELSGEPELAGFKCPVADLFYLPGEAEIPTSVG